MNILDAIAPRRGPKQRRLTKTFIAKAGFFVAVVAIAIFVLASVILFENDREIEQIPATRDSAEVVGEVQRYLQTASHRGFSNQSEPASCWNEFEDKEFTAEYLLQGSWQVNAFYSRIRYYWRVDDKTLEVTPDTWVTSRRDVLKKTYTPTINC